jgi:4-hydroxyacetophenone monooxygenase
VGSSSAGKFDLRELRDAVDLANVPTLLMILFHQTGDRKWLEAPFVPKPSRGIEDRDDGGLPEDVAVTIRDAAYGALTDLLEGERPAIGLPAPALATEMLSVAVGEQIPSEYGLWVSAQLKEGVGAQSVWNANQSNTDHRGSDDEVDEIDVLIIGAGVSGIAAAVRLGQSDFSYTILERNPSLGGVWLENRYPGAAVDTPNHLYSFEFFAGDWSRWFSEASDIHDYLRSVATEFGVDRHIKYETTVVTARFDSDSDRWAVDAVTSDGEAVQYQARILISGVGAFNAPVIPPIPGRETFSGPSFHSARWPKDLDLAGKDVSVIGNGASAMQIVPAIVDSVRNLTVFQLEPHWIAPFPRFKQDVPPAVRSLFKEVPLYRAWYRVRLAWLFNDKLHSSLRRDPAWPHPERSMNEDNDRFRNHLMKYLESELGERSDLKERLTPDYPPLGKRLLLDNGWYRALSRPNAELVSDEVVSINSNGLRTNGGRQVDTDVIVYATGFNVVSFLSTVDVVGKSGVSLHEVWDTDNASAYLGLAVPDFPNFFILYGPNTQAGHGGSLIELVEAQLTHILAVLGAMRSGGLSRIEVKRPIFDEYVARVDAEHAEMVWTHPKVETYYRNSRGRVIVNNPYRVVDFWHMTRQAGISSYDVTKLKEAGVPPAPLPTDSTGPRKAPV